MAVVHSAVWPNVHLAHSSVPFSVAVFPFSWATANDTKTTANDRTDRERSDFMVRSPVGVNRSQRVGAIGVPIQPRTAAGIATIQSLSGGLQAATRWQLAQGRIHREELAVAFDGNLTQATPPASFDELFEHRAAHTLRIVHGPFINRHQRRDFHAQQT